MTTITDRRMPRGRAISVFSLAVWWAKLEKNDEVTYNAEEVGHDHVHSKVGSGSQFLYILKSMI